MPSVRTVLEKLLQRDKMWKWFDFETNLEYHRNMSPRHYIRIILNSSWMLALKYGTGCVAVDLNVNPRVSYFTYFVRF